MSTELKSGQYSRQGIEAETPSGFEKVVEGHAAILFPPPKEKPLSATTENQKPKQAKKLKAEDAAGAEADEARSIFYNPAQVVNRDLSVCAIETFSEMRKTETRRKGGVGENGITILEALSATGLRAIRYWKEISGIRTIFANDLDKDAVDCIGRNCDYNGVPIADSQGGTGVVANCDDAIVLMQRLGLDENLPYRMAAVDPTSGKPLEDRKTFLQCEKVDVVDLDPYGTASPFIDPAMQCAKEGALMLVTCTDSSILCGNYPETCFAKYGTTSMRIDACHEMAPRIVLGLLEQSANKHKKYIQPLLSLHIDFYVRVFIRVYTQPAEVKRSCEKMGMVFHCTRCPCYRTMPMAETKLTRRQDKAKRARDTETHKDGDETPVLPLDERVYPPHTDRAEPVVTHCSSAKAIPNTCEACGSKVVMNGPLYLAPAHDVPFLTKLLETVQRKHGEGRLTATDRVTGLIKSAMDELPDTPLFYDLPEVASALHMHCPPTINIVGALRRLGYRCSQVHCRASGLKTSASPAILFGVLKHYDLVYPKEEEEASASRKEKKEKKASDAAAKGCLPVQIKFPAVECDVSYDEKYDWRSKKTGVAKFVQNAPGWGPKPRHTGVKQAPTE